MVLEPSLTNNNAPDRTFAYCVAAAEGDNHKAAPLSSSPFYHRGTSNSNNNTNGLTSSRSHSGSGTGSDSDSSSDSGNGAVPSDGTRFSKFINSIKYALGSSSGGRQQRGTAVLVGDHESSSSSSRNSSTRPLVIKSTSVIKRSAHSCGSSASELTDGTKRGGRHKTSATPDAVTPVANGIRNSRRT
ncbi:secreted protein C-like [Anopheles moucheti]|uniref:secreted protein C-like n=1 Tax=Anopheles moucheti TaxID=186751 RepID=UPI0022F11F28|nr:secreted protein C-like [Anopheles moucheti]